MRRAVPLTLLLLVAATARAQPARTLRAHPRGDTAIVVDGRLDEAPWSEADVARDFVERTPTPGAEPPVATEARVLYDDEALYVGLVMGLAPDEPPRALTLARDSFEIYSDDAVTVKLDVAHDHRTTIGFTVNATDAQLDYVAVENGRQFRAEFDAVWEAESHVSDGRWVVEMRIPAEALGLPEGDGERVIGLNVTRDHNAAHATYDWAHMPPEFGPVSAIHYGELTGLRGLGGGRPLTLIPYALVGWPAGDDVLDAGLPVRLRAGGDARMRLAEDIWGELTVLTDFAQVDLDDQVVNLDRFPLFLPEKRPFFLTGLDVFEFGDLGNAQLFFSRRIGLDEDGEPVPLWGGLKLYGRAGPLGFGLLDVVTHGPLTNWSVGRARANFGEASYVGVMATARNVLRDRDDAGYAFGVDGTVRAADERLELGASASATTGPGPQEPLEDRASGVVRARWRGEVLQPTASVLWVGDSFDPDVGFVLRRGIVRSSLSLPIVHRTRALGLDHVTVIPSAGLDASDELDRRLGARAGGALEVDFRSWSFVTEAEWVEDVVEREFELLPDVPIAPGRYRGVRAAYTLATSSRRNPYGSIGYEGSSAFFGGVLHDVQASGTVRLGRHLGLSVAAHQSFIQLPGRPTLRALTLNSVLSLSPSTRVTADVVFQVNDVDDTTVGLFRLRWRYLPGSDLFLVWRQDVAFDGTAEYEATLKATFRYDALL